MHQTDRDKIPSWLWLVCATAIIIALLFSQPLIGTLNNNNNGIRCLVQQFAEHRNANQTAHEADAAKNGYTAPTGKLYLPPPDQRLLDQYCEEFYEANRK